MTTFEKRVLARTKLGQSKERVPSTASDLSLESVHARQGHGPRRYEPVRQTNLMPTYAERMEGRSEMRAESRRRALAKRFGLRTSRAILAESPDPKVRARRHEVEVEEARKGKR